MSEKKKQSILRPVISIVGTVLIIALLGGYLLWDDILKQVSPEEYVIGSMSKIVTKLSREYEVSDKNTGISGLVNLTGSSAVMTELDMGVTDTDSKSRFTELRGLDLSLNAKSTVSGDKLLFDFSSKQNGSLLVQGKMLFSPDTVSVSVPQLDNRAFTLPADNIGSVWNVSHMSKLTGITFPQSLSYRAPFVDYETTKQNVTSAVKAFYSDLCDAVRNGEFSSRITRNDVAVNGTFVTYYTAKAVYSSNELVTLAEATAENLSAGGELDGSGLVRILTNLGFDVSSDSLCDSLVSFAKSIRDAVREKITVQFCIDDSHRLSGIIISGGKTDYLKLFLCGEKNKSDSVYFELNRPDGTSEKAELEANLVGVSDVINLFATVSEYSHGEKSSSVTTNAEWLYKEPSDNFTFTQKSYDSFGSCTATHAKATLTVNENALFYVGKSFEYSERDGEDYYTADISFAVKKSDDNKISLTGDTRAVGSLSGEEAKNLYSLLQNDAGISEFLSIISAVEKK